MKTSIKTAILDQQELSPGVFYIKLIKTHDFIPGQIISISTKKNGEGRFYSIASSVDDDFLGILYSIVEDGLLTPSLSNYKKGDSLYISDPFGQFLPIESQMVWIATGTGVAPFYSMMNSGFAKNSTLIHGARKREDFYFYSDFKKILKDNYIPCSSEITGNGYFQGRLSSFLDNNFIFPKCTYYLCGSSAMVVDIRDLLLTKGIEFANIVSEIYF